MRKQSQIVASILFFTLTVKNVLIAETPDFYSHDTKVVKERLLTMEAPFSPVYHPTVVSYIESFMFRARAGTRTLVGRSEIYFPVFEHYLDLYNLPRNLKYIAAWESRLDPRALSKAGAAGLWQMMPNTARNYGLTVNRRVDERLDPHKSTEAAVLYLADLYEIFGDWTLVAAAYNCGEGRVIKALKTGGKKDYWKLRRYLPRETASYVPAILAAAYALQYYNFYDIRPRYRDYDESLLRTSVVYENVSFRQIRKATGISVRELAALNPSYLKGYVPANLNGNYLRLPEKEAARLRTYLQKRQESMPRNKRVNVARPAAEDMASYPVLCVVKPGDTLEYLASLYKVSAKKIVEWNNLQTNRLVAFQEILIQVPVMSKTLSREES